MPFSEASYDAQTLALVTEAFEGAWHEVQTWYPGRNAEDLMTTRKMMALRIMTATKDGERDPERLKLIALRAVDGRAFD
jgi:hypothetical protein